MASAEQDKWVERVLGVVAAGSAGGDDEAELSTAELGLDESDLWAAATAAFRQAGEQVDGQISALQKALRAEGDPELDDIAELGLNALTRNTRVPLMAALMEAGDGRDGRLKAVGPKLEKAITSFRRVIASDPKVEAADNNPFDVDVSIRETFAGALAQLERAVKLAA